MTMLIASAGNNPDVYFNVLDEEYDNKIFEKYTPHQTSYTMSSGDTGNQADDKGGRPETTDPTNASTIQSKSLNSNNQPKPSTK